MKYPVIHPARREPFVLLGSAAMSPREVAAAGDHTHIQADGNFWMKVDNTEFYEFGSNFEASPGNYWSRGPRVWNASAGRYDVLLRGEQVSAYNVPEQGYPGGWYGALYWPYEVDPLDGLKYFISPMDERPMFTVPSGVLSNGSMFEYTMVFYTFLYEEGIDFFRDGSSDSLYGAAVFNGNTLSPQLSNHTSIYYPPYDIYSRSTEVWTLNPLSKAGYGSHVQIRGWVDNGVMTTIGHAQSIDTAMSNIVGLSTMAEGYYQFPFAENDTLDIGWRFSSNYTNNLYQLMVNWIPSQSFRVYKP